MGGSFFVCLDVVFFVRILCFLRANYGNETATTRQRDENDIGGCRGNIRWWRFGMDFAIKGVVMKLL